MQETQVVFFFLMKFLACGFVDVTLKAQTLKAQKGKGMKEIESSKNAFISLMSHCLGFSF